MCLEDQILSSYIDGELQEPWKTQVEEHISHCAECRERYEQFTRLNQAIHGSRLSEKEFSRNQQRVWNYLEKTCMPAQPKKFRHRRFNFSAPAASALAAALVVLLGANVFLMSNIDTAAPEGEQAIPTITAEAEDVPRFENGNDEVIGVSARAHQSSSIAPQELTVDELLFLLEQKGFEVELKRSDATEPVYSGSPASQEDSSGRAESREIDEEVPDTEEGDEPAPEDETEDGWSDWDDE